MSTSTDARTINPAEVRRAAIRDAAVVARLVGIAAIHRRLPDGRHEIGLHGKTWTGATLEKAIQAAIWRASK